MNVNGLKIAILLLDGRYGSTRSDGPETGDILAEVQWLWLEKELSNPGDVDLMILSSGTQVISTALELHSDGWLTVPKARRRLLRLMLDCPRPLLIISGDVHFAELNMLQCSNKARGKSRTLYDVTSSGLTHTIDNTQDVIGHFPGLWIFYDLPLYVVGHVNHFKAAGTRQRNYGRIILDKNGTIEFGVKHQDGQSAFKFVRDLDDLRTQEHISHDMLQTVEVIGGGWTCSPLRELPSAWLRRVLNSLPFVIFFGTIIWFFIVMIKLTELVWRLSNRFLI